MLCLALKRELLSDLFWSFGSEFYSFLNNQIEVGYDFEHVGNCGNGLESKGEHWGLGKDEPKKNYERTHFR